MREDLDREELLRYSRPLLVPFWSESGAQERLRGASVLLVGVGGLGCAVAASLVGGGVGRLVLCDHDEVSVSNLHRQTLFDESDIGHNKAEVAARRLARLNHRVRLQAHGRVTAENLPALLAEATLVIDAADNPATRHLVSEAAADAGKTCVWGAAAGTFGMLSVFHPPHRLGEIFPDLEDENAQSCEEAGVLGPLPAIIGQMMALEALKLAGGLPSPLAGHLCTFDALGLRMQRLDLCFEAQV